MNLFIIIVSCLDTYFLLFQLNGISRLIAMNDVDVIYGLKEKVLNISLLLLLHSKYIHDIFFPFQLSLIPAHENVCK